MGINKEIMNFIDNTPNSYFCVENIRRKLKENGFIELYENETWDSLESNKNYFVVRNDSSLIAFKMPETKEKIGFNIVAAHNDSPSFSIKPNADMYDGNYLKMNTSGYGGMLNYSWLDRPLSLAGRVVTYKDGAYEKQLIDIKKDLLVIPSQALHINREANSGVTFNHQTDMLPIIALGNEKKLNDIIKEEISRIGEEPEKICDYDLFLYNRDNAKYIGLNNEFILAPRLDDLASLFPALNGFVESDNQN